MFKQIVTVLAVFTFFSCEGPEGPQGMTGPQGLTGESGNNSLIRTTIEPIGENCSNGGTKIEAGVDTNGNGVLDDSEVSATSYVCNGEDGGQDQQIRLLLAAFGGNGNGTSSTTGDLFGSVIKFDKRNYLEINSIIFSPKVFSGNDLNQTFVELYNITDDLVVNNSTLSPSNSAISFETAEILQSDNIFEDLPEKEITLSIRLRTSNGSTPIFLTGESYLIMTRN